MKTEVYGGWNKREKAFLGILLHNKEAFKLEIAVRISQRIEAQGGFKDDVFSREMHALKTQTTF